MTSSSSDPFRVAWLDLKRRRLWLIGSSVWLLVAIVVSRRSTGSPWPVAPLVMAFATLILAIRCDRFRCPGCGQLFCRRRLFHNAFTRRCLHCGLEAGTSRSR